MLKLLFPALWLPLNGLLLLAKAQDFTEETGDSPLKNSLYFGVLHSIENLTTWAMAEGLIASLLEERMKLLENEANLIQTFLNDYNESTVEALNNLYEPRKTLEEMGRVVGSSVVLGHRMTSRFGGVTKRLREFLKSPEYKENEESVQTILGTVLPISSNVNTTMINSNVDQSIKFQLGSGPSSPFILRPAHWPDWPDMYMSFNSYSSMIEISGMSAEMLSDGVLLDTSVGGRLSAFHCMEFGAYALYRGRFQEAVEWLDMSLNLYDEEPTMGASSREKMSIEMIKSMLHLAIQEHNRNYMVAAHGINWRGSLFDFYVHPIKEETSTLEQEDSRYSFRSELYNEYILASELHPNAVDNSVARHIDICLGNEAQTVHVQMRLNCYYEHKRHPYLYINPVKVEKLSENPPVWQVYQVLGNATIERMKRDATPHLSLSSLVGVDETDFDRITQARTSVSAGLDEKSFSNVYKFGEIISGLKITNASETTQYVEYVYGRHYNYHADAYGESESTKKFMPEDSDDRLATMLYYLEVPELGGITSFVQAGIGAYHERGSAILWYNLYRNGTARKDVLHGACPVLHGYKIISNHWILYNGNWNHFKCSLNQFE